MRYPASPALAAQFGAAADRRPSTAGAARLLLAFIVATACAVETREPQPADAATWRRFADRCAALAAQAEEDPSRAIVGRDGWLFRSSELRFCGLERFWGSDARAVSRAGNPDHADPLPAIAGFAEALRARGIRLLLMPVPPKAVIQPEALVDGLSAPPPRLDLPLRAFLDAVGAAGVEVIDLTPTLLAERTGAHGPTYCRTDAHWSGAACVLAAGLVAARVRDEPWLTTARSAGPVLTATWQDAAIAHGDLAAGADPQPGPETIALRRIAGPEGAPPASTRGAPVLLIGDSHCLVFHEGGEMLARGAGLFEQLAYELRVPIELRASRGGGATRQRIALHQALARDPLLLDPVRLVVWCFTARELSEAADGWRPVALPAKPGP